MIIKMVLDSVIVTTVITNTVPTIVTITSISYFTSTTITLLIVIIMRVTVVFNSSCGDGEGRWWWPRVKTLPEGVRSDDNVDKGSEYKLLNHCVVTFFLTFHPSDRLTSLKQKTVDHFQSVTKSMLQSKERAKVSKQHRCWWGRSSRYQQLWKKAAGCHGHRTRSLDNDPIISNIYCFMRPEVATGAFVSPALFANLTNPGRPWRQC